MSDCFRRTVPTFEALKMVGSTNFIQTAEKAVRTGKANAKSMSPDRWIAIFIHTQ